MPDPASIFESQRRARLRTAGLLGCGAACVALLGFWATFANLAMAFAVGINVHPATAAAVAADPLRVCGIAASAFVAIWAALAGGLYLWSGRAVPAALGAKPADPETPLGRRVSRRMELVLLAAGRAGAGPALHVWDTPAANAFASGRSLSAGSVTVTRGLVEALGDDELEAVLGHEVAHLLNRDVVPHVQAVAFVLMVLGVGAAGAVLCALILAAGVLAVAAIAGLATLAIWFVAAMAEGEEAGAIAALVFLVALVGICLFAIYWALAALVVAFLLMAAVAAVFGALCLSCGLSLRAEAGCLSHEREYLADACAAQWTRNPAALAAALEKVASTGPPLALGGLLLEPLLFGRVRGDDQPWKRRAGRLFSTHPPVTRRIAVLRGMIPSGAPVPPEAAAGKILRVLSRTVPPVLIAAAVAGTLYLLHRRPDLLLAFFDLSAVRA